MIEIHDTEHNNTEYNRELQYKMTPNFTRMGGTHNFQEYRYYFICLQTKKILKKLTKTVLMFPQLK